MADDIRQWLEQLGLGEYTDAFVENRIGIDVLPDLDDDDFKDLGVALGDRKRVLRAIVQLGNSAAVPTTDEVADKPAQHSTAAERRQLTIMFCDLVGSTALSRQLDPEDLRDVMRRFQDAVAGAVARYGGHVAKYLGDGVLAYFGWPQAYEDQAERAVRSGLDAVAAVNDVKVSDGRSLEARVGISTGQVVVGDLVGESGRDAEAVTGETPNLAARLQGVAEPGQVVIGAVTARLIGGTFTMDDLSVHDLKGFDDTVQAWAITGEVATESRFDATHGSKLTEIVGRSAELQLLLDRWRLTANGEGQVVLISGEAGIGKSRLIQSLRDQIEGTDHIRVRYQCSPYHANSALYPTIQQLEYAAGFAPGDDGNAKLDKLEDLLGKAGEALAEDAPVFANLLSLSYEGRYGLLEQTPQQIKERLLAALITQLVMLAEQRPVLFLFEDAHWIDPTSLELLERAVGRLQGSRVLLIITHRPEWLPPFIGHNHVTSLQLNRLGKAQGAQIVRAIAGSHVPDDVVERIVIRTDGVPLYIEELTKTLVEGGLDIAEADIPATLQASLLARLDRLGPEAKEIAQIGAAIGRQFPLPLLAAVADRTDLEASLDRLTQSELVFRTGVPPEATYSFKHALIQDAAYDSMLRARRQTLHAAIARMLIQGPNEAMEREPETIAEHLEKAGSAEEATNYWYEAAQRSVAKSANVEAMHFTERAATQIRTLPESEANNRRRLAILTLELQPALYIHGYSAPETAALSERALALCREVGSDEELYRILYFRWASLHATGNGAPALKAATEYFQRSQQTEDEAAVIVGHRLIGSSLFVTGQAREAQSNLSRMVQLYRPADHDDLALQYGQDVLITGQCYLAMTSWVLGWPDQALKVFESALDRAAAIEHVPTLIYARGHLMLLRSIMGSLDLFRDETQASIEIAREHKNPYWPMLGDMFVAASDVLRDDMDVVDFEEVVARFEREQHAFYGSQAARQLVATFCLERGEIVDADRLIADSEAAHQKGYETYRAGEVPRLRGNYHLAVGDDAAAEYEFCKALELSQQQEAKSFELRAAVSLGRLWCGQGKVIEARNVLAPVYCWFSEGFDTTDLMEAKALLNELS
jgi:predicted ATPase/class 3 adenylate cyclase